MEGIRGLLASLIFVEQIKFGRRIENVRLIGFAYTKYSIFLAFGFAIYTNAARCRTENAVVM